MTKVLVLGPAFQVNILKKIYHNAVPTSEAELEFYPRGSNIISNLSRFLELLISAQKYDVVHALYPSHRITLKMVQHAVKNDKHVTLHWIGSDVLLAEKRNLFKKYDNLFNRVTNIAVAPWLKKELEEMNIPVDHIIPLVPPELSQARPLPLPKKFRVLYYLPKLGEKIYHPEIITLIAENFPDIDIIVVGGGDIPPLSNVVNLGRVPREDMLKVYGKIVVLVRYTKHDGLPLMILEALSYGRYIVYNRQTQNVIYVKNKNEILEKINILRDMFVNKQLKPNIVDLSSYNPQIIMDKLLNVWDISYPKP